MTSVTVENIDGREVGVVTISFVSENERLHQWYVVDKEIAGCLKLMGNFTIRNKKVPQWKPPFMKRRAYGEVKEIRLPLICVALNSASPERRMELAMSWDKMTDECEKLKNKVQIRPINGKAVDCRVENWLVTSDVLSENDRDVIKDVTSDVTPKKFDEMTEEELIERHALASPNEQEALNVVYKMRGMPLREEDGSVRKEIDFFKVAFPGRYKDSTDNGHSPDSETTSPDPANDERHKQHQSRDEE